MWKDWDEIDASCEREALAIAAKKKITPKIAKKYYKVYKNYYEYITTVEFIENSNLNIS